MAAGQINAIRVQDLSTGKWYSYDNSGWDKNGAPKIKPGKNRIYIAFWATNYSTVGTLGLTIKDGDTGVTMAARVCQRVQPWGGDINKGVGIESTTHAQGDWKGKAGIDMPGHKLSIKCVVYPGSTETIVLTPDAAATKGVVYAVRVKDIKNQGVGDYYNYNVDPQTGKGSWDREPKVAAGLGNLYVAFWAYNTGLDGDLYLELVDGKTGQVLKNITGYAATDGGVGLEWTGDMPQIDIYNLLLKVSPSDQGELNIAIQGEGAPSYEEGILEEGLQYLLNIDSDPQNTSFSVVAVAATSDEETGEKKNYVTPYSLALTSGRYKIEFSSSLDSRQFKDWEDGSTSNTRIIDLNSNMDIKAAYSEANKYTLAIETDPADQLFSINELQFITPYSDTLTEGQYTIKVPAATYDNRPFEAWEDGSTNPERVVNLTANMTLKASYEKPEEEEEEEPEEVPSGGDEEEVTEHGLSIKSVPTGEIFSINNAVSTTPYSATLKDGTYTINMPETSSDGKPFEKWEDGSTNPTRTINLTSDKTLTATYQGETAKSPCEQQYGDWGILNGLRNAICNLQGISTE